MAVISLRANQGLAGSISRQDNANVVEAVTMDSTKPVTQFGDPCKIVSGQIEAIEASDTASDFFGIVARVAPTIAGDTGASFNSATPSSDYAQSVVRKGYVNVACTVGTPAKGGAVYMRVQTDTGKALGDLEATKDASVAGGTITGTGTGTLAITEDGTAKAGTWSIVLQETSATAEFYLFDPDGFHVGTGNVGTELVAGGLTMTITNGGTMTAGDSFAPVVTDANVAIANATWNITGKDGNNISEIYIA